MYGVCVFIFSVSVIRVKNTEVDSHQIYSTYPVSANHSPTMNNAMHNAEVYWWYTMMTFHHAMPHSAMSHHTLSHAMSSHIKWYHITHVISCNVTLCYVISCHVMSHHIISCHVMIIHCIPTAYLCSPPFQPLFIGRPSDVVAILQTHGFVIVLT